MPAETAFHVPSDFTQEPVSFYVITVIHNNHFQVQFVALEDTGAILTHSRKGLVAIGEKKTEISVVSD